MINIINNIPAKTNNINDGFASRVISEKQPKIDPKIFSGFETTLCFIQW